MNLEIDENDVFWGYHIGDGLDEYTLCKFIPVKIDNGNDSYQFKDDQTNKWHLFYSKKIKEELGKNPLDAFIKFNKILESKKEEYIGKIEKLGGLQQRFLEEARGLMEIKLKTNS